MLHEQATTVAQVKIDRKSNEIASVSTLLAPLEISDRVGTNDALHTQRKTAKYLVEDKKASYFFTVTVKGNQLTTKADIELLNLTKTSPDHFTIEKGHGRIETRLTIIWIFLMLDRFVVYNVMFLIVKRKRFVTKPFMG